MLNVSCDVAYLLCTTTLWSGLCFLQWESLDPPPPPPPSPFPTAFQPMALYRLRPRADSQAVRPWASYVTSESWFLHCTILRNGPLKLLRGLQEKWLANSARVGLTEGAI